MILHSTAFEIWAVASKIRFVEVADVWLASVNLQGENTPLQL